MLKIFNELKPFFEDCYRDISVRQYASMTDISPPTASKTLKELEKENLLISENKGIYIYFRANRENFVFKQLIRIYWYQLLSHLTEEIYELIAYKRIILFGSLTKAENTLKSDLDLYLESESREINTLNIEKKLKRKVQLHFINSMKNENLKKNIEQGVIIR